MSSKQTTFSNLLLKALTPSDFRLFEPHLKSVDLPSRFPLVMSNRATEEVYFLESGLASAVAQTSDDETIEIGHIGREGMSAPHVILTTDVTPNNMFMQISGSGRVMPVAVFRDLLDDHIAVRRLFLSYVHASEIQLSQSAVANARYSVNERLARWILMIHDRVDGDELPLTHEFLAQMLGVRRSGVTDQIHMLERREGIKATRGKIIVRDRSVLLEIAGGCYGVAEREYEKLIGQSYAR